MIHMKDQMLITLKLHDKKRCNRNLHDGAFSLPAKIEHTLICVEEYLLDFVLNPTKLLTCWHILLHYG